MITDIKGIQLRILHEARVGAAKVLGIPPPADPFTTGAYGAPGAIAAPGVPPTSISMSRGISDGGSGGGEGGSGSSATVTPLNWRDYLSNWGFPSDVVDELDRIFRNDTDANRASQRALGYIRGTPWYTQHFPGIEQGLSKGLVSNEQDYRTLLNQQNQLYRQYFGRDTTTNEFTANLNRGVSANMLEREFAGDVYAKTNEQDLQGLLGAFGDTSLKPGELPLTQEQLTAYGRENTGIDTLLGSQIQRKVNMAKQRLATVFQGTLATPSMSFANGRLASTSATTRPDIPA